MENSDVVYKPAEDSLLLQKQVRRMARKGMAVLDVGTGNGIQAITAAKNGASVTAIDVNPHAVKLAKRNAKLEGVRITVIESDLFQKLKKTKSCSFTTIYKNKRRCETTPKFDLIIFNPPYLPTTEEEKRHDLLEKAWDGGPTGREVLDEFLVQVNGYLKPKGILLFVQSSLTGIGQTEDMLNKLGFQYKIVAEEKLSWELLSVLRAERL